VLGPIAPWRRAAGAIGAVAVVFSFLAATAWVGCSIYDPSLLLPGIDAAADAPADSVAVEATTQARTHDAAPNPCPQAYPPALPAADDPSDAGDQSFVVALHTLDFGLSLEAGATATLGYDLDGVFTCCADGGESCKGAVPGAMHCDDPGGRDDSAGRLLRSLASLNSQFNDTAVSQRLQQGVYSVLLQVLHYNGQRDDTQVTAALYAADGLAAAGDAAPGLAKWDGTDVWTIDSAFVLTPDAPPIIPTHFDGNAYVAGGTLVVHVDFPVSLGSAGSGDLTLSLTSGVITADVLPAKPGTYRLANGQIAGRWNNRQLLSAIQSLALPANLGTGNICYGTAEYAFVKQEVCLYADIMTDPASDNTGAMCDAISIGFGFTADPAIMGKVVPSATNPDSCDGGASIPDDCTTP
jgi:hypothetical protein